jgi:stress-induced morphogen
VADPKIKRQLRDYFKKAFVRHPDEWVRVKTGFAENVHIAIVSRKFDHKGAVVRHRMTHDLLFRLPKEVWGYVTLIEEFSPNEKGKFLFPRRGPRRAKRA